MLIVLILMLILYSCLSWGSFQSGHVYTCVEPNHDLGGTGGQDEGGSREVALDHPRAGVHQRQLLVVEQPSDADASNAFKYNITETDADVDVVGDDVDADADGAGMFLRDCARRRKIITGRRSWASARPSSR